MKVITNWNQNAHTGMHTYYIISIHLYMCTFTHNYVYILCVLARCHTIIGLLGLEKTTKIIKSNHPPITPLSTDHVPQCSLYMCLDHVQGQWLQHLPGELYIWNTVHCSCKKCKRYGRILCWNIMLKISVKLQQPRIWFNYWRST